MINPHVGYLDYYWRKLDALWIRNAVVQRLLRAWLRHLKVVIEVKTIASVLKGVLSCSKDDHFLQWIICALVDPL